MPLHTDYRPKDFNEVIGNRAVIQSHESIFQRESDYPHAVLYVGPSGCGKTTLARIYANRLGCKGRDIHEYNIADLRGIDTARKIQSEMSYSPFQSPVKCYILDEVHASTKDFQNGMLKALEDAPPHVYFLMATTDPQNLLPTLRNRCSIFEVSLLDDREMRQLLTGILEAEKIDDIPQEVIDEICIIAEGCPRQALVTLDKIIDMAPPDMLEAVQGFQVVERTTKELCQALLYRKGWGEVSKIMKGMDLTKAEDIRRAVLRYMTAVLLNNSKDSGQAALVMEFFKEPTYNSGKAGLVFAAYNSLL